MKHKVVGSDIVQVLHNDEHNNYTLTLADSADGFDRITVELTDDHAFEIALDLLTHVMDKHGLGNGNGWYNVRRHVTQFKQIVRDINDE